MFDGGIDVVDELAAIFVAESAMGAVLRAQPQMAFQGLEPLIG